MPFGSCLALAAAVEVGKQVVAAPSAASKVASGVQLVAAKVVVVESMVGKVFYC